jgi:hypothetical protein
MHGSVFPGSEIGCFELGNLFSRIPSEAGREENCSVFRYILKESTLGTDLSFAEGFPWFRDGCFQEMVTLNQGVFFQRLPSDPFDHSS